MTDERDEFAERLAGLHEEIVQGPAMVSLQGSENDELAGCAECLALIDRVRRRVVPRPISSLNSDPGDTTVNDAGPSGSSDVFDKSANRTRDDNGPDSSGAKLSSAWSWEKDGNLPRRIGRFEIVRELGHGGVGMVFLAVDPALNRHVALKIPLPHVLVAKEMRTRFLREGEATARLRHPHIIGVHEVGQDGPVCYIAAEYCPGSTLDRWLKSRPAPVDPRVAAEIVRRLGDAVAHAHSQAVLHRDIKPSNVLLANPNDEPTTLPLVKLGDFGLAKLLDDDRDSTRTGDLIGTPAYMSPEQAEGKSREIDVRTDVYALGVILFELLTGRTPFQGETRSAIIQKVILEDPPKIERLVPNVPRDLAVIVQKSLSKSKSDRYSTANELAEDLRLFLDGKVIRARPSGILERIVKWIRRRPTAATLAALAILFPITVLLMFARSVYLQSAANDEIRKQRDIAIQRELESRQKSYVAQMRRAGELLEHGQSADVLNILAEFQPKDGQADVRNLLWGYLYREASKDLPVQWQCHEDQIYSIDFSPDGREIVTASPSGCCFVWNWETKTLRHSLAGHEGDVNEARFSPDGLKIATCGDDGSVRIWNRETGDLIHMLLRHEREAGCISFHPAGKWLASGGRDARVCVWDVDTGELVAEKTSLSGRVLALAYTPDGETLLTSTRGRLLTAWDKLLSAIQWQRGPMDGINCDFNSIGMDEIGERAILAGSNGAVWPIRLRTGEREPNLEVARDRLPSLCVLGEGQRVAVADLHGRISIWSIDGRNEVARLSTVHDKLWSVALNHATGEIAWSTSDGSIYSVVDRKGDALQTVAQLDGAIRRLERSTDGATVFAASSKELVAYDTATRRIVRRFPNLDGTRYMDVSPEDKRLVVVDDEGRVRVWDAKTFEIVQELPVPLVEGMKDPEDRCTIAFLGDASRFALPVGPEEDHLLIWNIDEGKREGMVNVGHGQIRSLAYLGENRLAVGAMGAVCLYQCRPNGIELLASVPVASPAECMSDLDSEGLLVGFQNGCARQFDVPTLHEIPGWGDTLLGGSVNEIVRDRDRRWFAPVGEGVAVVFDRKTGRVERRLSIPADARSVHSACVAEESDTLYLGCRSGAILLASIHRHDDSETLLAPSPVVWMQLCSGGMEVVSQQQGGHWTLIDAARGAIVRFPPIEPISHAAILGDTGQIVLVLANEIAILRRSDYAVVRRFEWTKSVVWRLLPLASGLLAVQDERSEVDVLNLEDGNVIEPFRESREGWKAVAVSADGTRLALSRADRSLEVWTVGSGQAQSLGDHSHIYTALAFSPDGQTLFAGDDHGSIHLWDMATGTLLAEEIALPSTQAVAGLSIAPDGFAVAIADGSRTVRIWDRRIGNYVFDFEHAKDAGVNGVEFAPDGSYLTTCGSRGSYGSVRFWRAKW